MAKIITTKAQACGIPLGGIGTGSVELFPDGEFHQWQIANQEKWAFARNGTDTIFRHNYAPNYGLVNASCPDGRPVSPDTYENCQAITIWTGIGYTIAALALSLRREDISHTIMESTHENQLRCGRLWDHEESGPHYTRPLSSWTTLIAACGLEVDAYRRKLKLTPTETESRYPSAPASIWEPYNSMKRTA